MNPLMLIKPLLGVAKPLLSLGGGLLKNPVVDLVVSKTSGAIQHKIDKDKIIRAKEIEGATKTDLALINAQKDSIKDEIVTATFMLLLLGHFVPYTQPFMARGWEILKNADPMFWIIISIVVSASMGVTGIQKIFPKKK
tara:strand:+ start:6269 stop:6685 length:417 start_codon:yes stop_codon:yes gene_type:complete